MIIVANRKMAELALSLACEHDHLNEIIKNSISVVALHYGEKDALLKYGK